MGIGKQQLPQSDNRKRKLMSPVVSCYVADFKSDNTLDFSRSIFRVVFLAMYYGKYLESVQYNDRYRPVYSSKRMEEIIKFHLENGGIVNIGGKLLHSVKDDYEPYPFISVMSKDCLLRHPKHQEILLNPDYSRDAPNSLNSACRN